MTPSEAIMWGRLRGRRLGGFKFYRQHVIKNYIVDFFNNDALLVVEIDGSVHGDRDVQTRDEERSRSLALLGYHTIRFTSLEVEQNADAVCELILDAIYRSINAQLASHKNHSRVRLKSPSQDERGGERSERGEPSE